MVAIYVFNKNIDIQERTRHSQGRFPFLTSLKEIKLFFGQRFLRNFTVHTRLIFFFFNKSNPKLKIEKKLGNVVED